ncbi:sensor histidine kinase [Bacteroidota bacterium]
MSKRILQILTLSLALGMMGLIIVQIYWIKNAIKLHDKQFIQLVNSSLSDISSQVEKHYTMKRMQYIDQANDAIGGEIEWSIMIKEDEVPDIELDIKDPPEMKHIETRKDHDDLLEIVGDTIIIINASEPDESDTIALEYFHEIEELKKIEESLHEREIKVKAVLKEMLLEDVSFEERIEQELFEKFITSNFHKQGIEMDYEYMVLKNNKKEVYTSANFNKKTDSYIFSSGLTGGLPKEDEDTYLYLYFPDHKSYVRASTGLLAGSSVLLTVVMIILFSFALFVIFRQKKLSDIKNDFVSNMTHELKTPISTISLASQMLSDNSIPKEKKNTEHISRIIQTESKRLGYQVERVLQMAVLDEGHLVLKKVPAGMGEIVSAVIQNFRIQVENKQGSIAFENNAEYDTVYGDRVHLMNVVTNLMDNAVKYCNERPDINVTLSNTSASFLLTIADNGIGISKDNQKKVFDRFYRVSTGNVHDVKGFGLGLSYVKLIVEQHGGTIQLTSELDKGTTFSINLPLYSETEQS